MNTRHQIATLVTGTMLTLGSLISVPAEAAILRADQPIAGQYIVVFRDGAVRRSTFEPGIAPLAADLTAQLARNNGARVDKQYGAALSGFSFSGTAAAAAALARDPRIAYVAEDGWVELAGEQTPVPSWGLDRIDQREPVLDGIYNYSEDGMGVDVYIVDTGIRSTHQEFGNRVDTAAAFTAVNDGWGTEDCNGHGTHVAGVVGGSTFGVAKGVTLHPVRVVDCNGLGPVSNMIAGIDWIAARYPGNSPTHAVVNMSLRAGYSYPLEQAILASIARGITYVAAAGNDNDDACWLSPGRVPEVITVGASDATNARWTSSNFGACVDLFAPGVLIPSALFLDDTSSAPMTGTSAASPHVAGTAALLLAANPNLTPADIQSQLVAAATSGALTDVGEESPNRLLFTAPTTVDPDSPPVADFSYSCQQFVAGCGFDASRSSDDWGIVDYSWDFGDGTTGSGVKTNHSYRTSLGPMGRRYTVTLTVTDTTGQVTEFARLIQTSR